MRGLRKHANKADRTVRNKPRTMLNESCIRFSLYLPCATNVYFLLYNRHSVRFLGVRFGLQRSMGIKLDRKVWLPHTKSGVLICFSYGMNFEQFGLTQYASFPADCTVVPDRCVMVGQLWRCYVFRMSWLRF